jgi:hypothetical protein
MKLAETDDAMLTKKYSSGAEFFRGKDIDNCTRK